MEVGVVRVRVRLSVRLPVRVRVTRAVAIEVQHERVGPPAPGEGQPRRRVDVPPVGFSHTNPDGSGGAAMVVHGSDRVLLVIWGGDLSGHASNPTGSVLEDEPFRQVGADLAPSKW